MIKQFNWNKKTILIVDDEYMNYLLFEAILEETKSKVIYAVNGAVAIEECQNNKEIDLILMDIKMPVVNGYEAVKIIKNQSKEIPIIAQTAYTASEDYYKCIEAGFDDYIPKPIERELLLYKLSTYFEQTKVPKI
ncbi:response regulator [Bacteroidota bacterium]